MKKSVTKRIALIILPLLLASCGSSSSSKGSSGGFTPSEEWNPNLNLVLTEMNTGVLITSRAVEFSNISDEEIDLNNYSLEVYRNRSNISTESISLNGQTIVPHSSFVVAYSGSKEEMLEKADLIVDNYLNDGTFPVALAYKGKPFDCIGLIGYSYDFAHKSPLVRLKEYLSPSLSFDLSNWIRYPINTISTLGNYDCISENDLLAGPKLTNDDFNKPFCVEQAKGSGGLIKVGYVRNYDGDTTLFNYGNSYSSFEISGNQSTRYYAINTPEIAHSLGEKADPYGNEARDFTESKLNSAKQYYVQSVDGYSFRETYGRMLGYVWISFVNNPSPGDFILLNILIIKEGFSNPAFLDRHAAYNSNMIYNGITYIEYAYFAQQYAIKNHLNIHSGE